MIPLFDAHCDTAYEIFKKREALRKNGGHTDLERRGAYAPCAQFFAIFEDSGEAADPIGSCREELAYLKRQIAENDGAAALCRTAREAEAAFEAGKTAAFIAVEGAELIGCSIQGLKRAYDDGVRSVNITWNHANALCGSNADEPERGLSETGVAFVRCCRELGMLVDMSHISERGFWDAYELGGAMFASHSNSKALCPHSRNLTDEQFKAIVETGGAAGLNLYADFVGENADIDAVVAHAERFLSLGGERAVCIGADLDGCERLPRGIRGIEDMGVLYEAFLRKNYPEGLVRDIFFNNLFGLVERTFKAPPLNSAKAGE